MSGLHFFNFLGVGFYRFGEWERSSHININSEKPVFQIKLQYNFRDNIGRAELWIVNLIMQQFKNSTAYFLEHPWSQFITGLVCLFASLFFFRGLEANPAIFLHLCTHLQIGSKACKNKLRRFGNHFRKF